MNTVTRAVHFSHVHSLIIIKLHGFQLKSWNSTNYAKHGCENTDQKRTHKHEHAWFDQRTRLKKKLSYHRDSARRRSIRRSRSYKVTAVSTNRKSLCDFLFV